MQEGLARTSPGRRAAPLRMLTAARAGLLLPLRRPGRAPPPARRRLPVRACERGEYSQPRRLRLWCPQPSPASRDRRRAPEWPARNKRPGRRARAAWRPSTLCLECAHVTLKQRKLSDWQAHLLKGLRICRQHAPPPTPQSVKLGRGGSEMNNSLVYRRHTFSCSDNYENFGSKTRGWSHVLSQSKWSPDCCRSMLLTRCK